jgi:hypothetical protein
MNVHTPNPAGTTQLPCNCIVATAPGQLGACERQPQCLGDPR